MKKESVISNWGLFNMGTWFQLRGNVHNDERFEEGAYIYSSMVLRIDFEKGTVETKNTIYRLF